jgi:hypothetical protein
MGCTEFPCTTPAKNKQILSPHTSHSPYSNLSQLVTNTTVLYNFGNIHRQLDVPIGLYAQHQPSFIFVFGKLHTAKQRLAIIPSPAGMSLTSLVNDNPAGDRKMANLFCSVTPKTTLAEYKQSLYLSHSEKKTKRELIAMAAKFCVPSTFSTPISKQKSKTVRKFHH